MPVETKWIIKRNAPSGFLHFCPVQANRDCPPNFVVRKPGDLKPKAPNASALGGTSSAIGG